MAKKIIDTATKTGTDDAKTAFKWVVQKTAEATGDKITSIGKSKKKKQTKKAEGIYIPPEKKAINY